MHMFSLIPPLLVPHMQLRIPPDSSPTQRPMIGSPSTSHWTFFFFFWVTAGGDAELTKVCLALLSRVFQILDRLCGKRSRLEHGLPKQTLLASVPILITIVSEAEVMWFSFTVLEVKVQNEFHGVWGEAVGVAASLWRLERRVFCCLPSF